tara:strand:- start:180 stop:1196 length:1017 start_codon:yes stop_codon:yes gene_type:complete
VKPAYTKAAHLACLRDLLPANRLTIVGEQEASMVRVVPHAFRDWIEENRCERHVMNFDKNALEPENSRRATAFKAAFDTFKMRAHASGQAQTSNYTLLSQYCASTMTPAFNRDPNGHLTPFPITNFRSAQFPQMRVRSGVEIHGETRKVVGFPVIRKKYRQKLKRSAFHVMPANADLCDALTRRYVKATIHPVSSFMNSLRERVSPTKRAGGRSARNGPSYINGATYNPAVLVAFLTIYRIYFNWFEERPYLRASARNSNQVAVSSGTHSIRCPGSQVKVKALKQRKVAPIQSTPALRLGVDARRMASTSRSAPDPRRILYRPWLYHAAPLWKKFETR